MNPPQPNAFAELHRPTASFASTILPSLGWGLLWSIVLTLLLLLGSWISALAVSARPNLPHWIYSAAILNGLLFVVLSVGRMVYHSRPAQDRAFTVVGFLATFFGLAMLLVFFMVLGYETVQWFHYTPRLVASENKKWRTKLDEVAQYNKAKMTEVDQELQMGLEVAETEQEKQELRAVFDKEVYPAIKKDLDARAQDLLKEANIREDPTAASVLHYFFTHGPNNRPQDVGIRPALIGSLWICMITLIVSVPVGVAAAIYLEEYKTSGTLGYLIQININNLAGVPSVVYGILGSFVFVYIFRILHEYHPAIAARNLLGGGLTLALLSLPIVIVSAQEAIRAVPSSIREGALALGATRWQTIWHQVMPVARPGIMTGTILSISRAVGEAAPLVLFGALLFVNRDPHLFSRFTVLPMQIFGWADRPPERVPPTAEEKLDHYSRQAATAVGNMAVLAPAGPYAAAAVSVQQGPARFNSIEIWKYNAAIGCVVLLFILMTMNGAAIVLRNRAQHRMRV